MNHPTQRRVAISTGEALSQHDSTSWASYLEPSLSNRWKLLVASKKTLNAKNLEELGATRLAELLLEISTGNAAAKRRLRLELAGAESPAEVAREVDKRLSTIRRSRSYVDWQSRRALVDDLKAQRRAIVEQVAQPDPDEGLTLMWRFLGLANSIFERCDDGSGTIIGLFHDAVVDLGQIASRAGTAPQKLADAVYEALRQNHYGQYDNLISALAPAMGQAGLLHLKGQIAAQSRAPAVKPASAERQRGGWSSTTGAIFQDEIDERARDRTARIALMEIADALGDVDGVVAQYDDLSRKVPLIAAAIAERLLGVGRGDEALAVLDDADHRKQTDPELDWVSARIAVLEALGRGQEAQDMRWSCFEETLSAPHLRDYLKLLADFEDIDAEHRAFEHAQAFADVHIALVFLASWPALEQAARLVVQRAGELDGDYYEHLTPAADALSAKYPLAASLLLRAMIDFTLTAGRSGRYKHAARHLLECSSLSRHISDYGEFETHEAYEARLRQEHCRKSGFWGLLV